jgi:hypothetical protein
VQAIYDNGITLDVTAKAHFNLLVKRSPPDWKAPMPHFIR